jgi:F-type H+-transporting ATPase subunit alpha
VEILKQAQYEPLPVEKQILIIYAGTNGFVDHLPVSALKKYEQELYSFAESRHPDLLPEIVKKRELNEELRAKMKKVLEEFNASFKE